MLNPNYLNLVMSTSLFLKISESDTRYGFRPAIAARDLLHQQLECKLYTVPCVLYYIYLGRVAMGLLKKSA